MARLDPDYDAFGDREKKKKKKNGAVGFRARYIPLYQVSFVRANNQSISLSLPLSPSRKRSSTVAVSSHIETSGRSFCRETTQLGGYALVPVFFVSRLVLRVIQASQRKEKDQRSVVHRCAKGYVCH